MKIISLVILWYGAAAQIGGPQMAGARLVEVRTEPRQPSFGEKFDVHVRLRVRHAVTAFLPDTLLPSASVQSAGKAAWVEAPAPGDSVEVRATYPVIGFREGNVQLPSIELWVRPVTAGVLQGGKAVQRATEAPKGSRRGLDRRVMRLGDTVVGPYKAMADSGAQLAPRPPADVLGGEWSLWLLLAVGIGAIAGVLVLGRVMRWWWPAQGAALFARLQGKSPRQDALRELERILSLGWHKNGRMDDFYESTTGTLRRYSAATRPDCGPSLTSTELLASLAGKWGPGRVEALARTVAVAERVKFGALQPGAEAAEGDWRTIVQWIRETPEG